ncbi:hypothetical protein JPSP3_06370 [Staphylococcus pseudintermedius]
MIIFILCSLHSACFEYINKHQFEQPNVGGKLENYLDVLGLFYFYKNTKQVVVIIVIKYKYRISLIWLYLLYEFCVTFLKFK